MIKKKSIPQKTDAWRTRLEGEIRRARNISVLGAGNALRGDDVAGLALAEALARRISGKNSSTRRIQILKTFEVPENFTGAVRAFGPDLVILIDAAVGNHPPGEVFFIDPAAIEANDLSTHRIPLSALVRFMKEDMGCAVLVLGIEPLSLDFGTPISRPVARTVRALARILARILLTTARPEKETPKSSSA